MSGCPKALGWDLTVVFNPTRKSIELRKKKKKKKKSFNDAYKF